MVRLVPRWIDRNLSRLEQVVSMLLVALFIGWFGHYALVMFAEAERAMLQATVTNINTALRHQALTAAMKKDRDFYAGLQDINPMVDLQPRGELDSAVRQAGSGELDIVLYSYGILYPTANYLGEYGAGGPQAPEGGHWYYDKTNKELVYLVRNTEYFVSEGKDEDRVRFKVVINYADANNDGEYSPAVDKFHSVRFVPLNTYSWRL
ncbi:MAG: hypothetical protein WD356_00005 [Pseudomonadales bacterium]